MVSLILFMKGCIIARGYECLECQKVPRHWRKQVKGIPKAPQVLKGFKDRDLSWKSPHNANEQKMHIWINLVDKNDDNLRWNDFYL